MKSPDVAQRVDAVRAFNRFYTRLIGVISEGLLETPYSLMTVAYVFGSDTAGMGI